MKPPTNATKPASSVSIGDRILIVCAPATRPVNFTGMGVRNSCSCKLLVLSSRILNESSGPIWSMYFFVDRLHCRFIVAEKTPLQKPKRLGPMLALPSKSTHTHTHPLVSLCFRSLAHLKKNKRLQLAGLGSTVSSVYKYIYMKHIII